MRNQSNKLWAWLLTAIAVAWMVSIAHAENTLWALNAQRKAMGLYPLMPDPYLQTKAEWAARERARRRMHGHLLRRFVSGRWVNIPVAGHWEGVASRSSRQRGPAGEYWGPEDVYACYQDQSMARYAGCASVLGSDGRWYYQLNLR